MAVSGDSMNMLIREAFGELCKEEYQPHEEAPPIPVSFPFDLYMEELLDERARRTVRFRRLGWSSAILLLVAALLIFSVMLAWDQTNTRPTNPIQTLYPGNDMLNDLQIELLPRVEHAYYFAKQLEGYERIKEERSLYAVREVWTDGEHTLEVWQSCTNWRAWRGLQCEFVQKIKIHDTEARAYGLSDGSRMVLWSNTNYFMELRVMGNHADPTMTVDRLIEWAESLTPVPLYEPGPDEEG